MASSWGQFVWETACVQGSPVHVYAVMQSGCVHCNTAVLHHKEMRACAELSNPIQHDRQLCAPRCSQPPEMQRYTTSGPLPACKAALHVQVCVVLNCVGQGQVSSASPMFPPQFVCPRIYSQVMRSGGLQLPCCCTSCQAAVLSAT